MYSKKINKIIILSLVILFLFSISSCRQNPRSTVLTLPSLKLGSSVQEKIDLDGDGKDEMVSLLKTSEGVRIRVNNVFEDCSLDADEFMDASISVSLKVLNANDNQNYLFFSYNMPSIGQGFGNEFKILLMKYTSDSLVNIWDGNLSGMNHHYANNLFSISFPEDSLVVTKDISYEVNKLNSWHERFEPLTVEDILNAPLLSTCYDVGVMDYDGDGHDEIITAFDLRDNDLGSYISSAFLVWDVDNGKVIPHSGLLSEVLPENENSQDNEAFSDLIHNGFLMKSQISAWDLKNGTDYQTRVNELIASGFLAYHGDKIMVG